MKNEAMVTIDLIGHGIDYRAEVPAQMLFEYISAVPELVDVFGVEQSKEQYSEMLEEIQSEYESMAKISWGKADDEAYMFMRKCVILTVLGGILHDIPLMMIADDVQHLMGQTNAINITHEVESGRIPISNFKGHELFKERCKQ